jgi:glycosyltransferase involved in cell wall biosynthesis
MRSSWSDTGSTDRTAEIARSFGARVFDFVWVDDFAAARNEALERATGDYAFWLDADDMVAPPEREKPRALLDGLRRRAQPTADADIIILPASQPEVSAARSEPRPPEDCPAAYVVRCACDPAPDGTGRETVVDHIRLFPLRPSVRWTYRVHEQILPSLRQAKIPVRWSDLTVRHTGYVDEALRDRKLDRDTRILKPSSTSGLVTRSYASISAPSPSSGRSGPRRSGFSSGAWPARRRPIRLCANCMP